MKIILLFRHHFAYNTSPLGKAWSSHSIINMAWDLTLATPHTPFASESQTMILLYSNLYLIIYQIYTQFTIKTVFRISSTIFEMAYGLDPNNGIDSDCLATIADPSRSEDYLYIPGSKMITNIRADKFCGRSLMASMLTSKTPGPFIMYFNSDQLYDSQKPERGFSLYYEVL